MYARQALYQLSYTPSPKFLFLQNKSFDHINSNETVSPMQHDVFIYWHNSDHTVWNLFKKTYMNKM